ncbi:hypothetical protein NSA24_06890 [Clostridioides mangenotii]|uniref:hypothetical protein n=1 Tax=Metaclostridioides mangenotii TaxID=1540 RepID=UPI00214A506D|nr:hypothetical protein [Clostridioides mangenotii]MCR1954515.1 hypothetical protein [Clostridioides mangenotii]
MERISILYFYPDFVKINNEINLIRIVDNKVKEGIIIFAEDNVNEVVVNLTNTNVGEVIPIVKMDNMDNLEIVVNNIRENENKIKSLKDLSDIEKHLLSYLIVK